MIRIVDGINNVTAVVGDISNASKEQTAGIEKINHAMASMDEATRNNAALVEEAAAAALALQEQAQALNGLVSVFKIASTRAAPPQRRSLRMLAAAV
jgi:methyl-accepting chemotaxis protein